MARIGLSSPWMEHYRKIEALFAGDFGVKVVYNEEEQVVGLFVDNPTKAAALEEILPAEMAFGNVVLKIAVIPGNQAPRGKKGVFEDAFDGNAALAYVKKGAGIFAGGFTYVVFRNKVVQYWTDDLGDAHGLCSTLYEDIARDVFVDKEGVFFCTDVPEGSPLATQKWP